MQDFREYEFSLPDGSRRYEIVADRSDAFRFQRMHGATGFRPVDDDSADANPFAGAPVLDQPQIRKSHDARAVSVWRLADDAGEYGERAGWFILTTPDGEGEMPGGPWAEAESAEAHAKAQGWQVVPLML